MPTSKSARKRVRQNDKQRLRNRMGKSALRTAVKKFQAAEQAGDAEAATAAYAMVQERADRSVQKDTVHKRTASRIKSRLSARLEALRKAK